MHIYAFGSICRGDITLGSDVDLLAISDENSTQIDADMYSIYTYERINELWAEGNPFAWHLHLESKLIFSSNNEDYLNSLGAPNRYIKSLSDCQKFYNLFIEAKNSLIEGGSIVFDLSTIFLSIRNISTCFLLGQEKYNFRRSSALGLGILSLSLPDKIYSIFERSRILCTRGYGDMISDEDLHNAVNNLDLIDAWMKTLLERCEKDE